jgi:molecular chaperone GrpE
MKKRFDREVEQTKSYCNERIIMQLLDVVDELELAVKNGEISSQSTENLLEGVEMTLKKLRKVLEQEGVTEIANPEGKVFDPTKHNAVATVESDDAEDGIVLEQIRKGYIMRGKVIRPTIVKVAVKKLK